MAEEDSVGAGGFVYEVCLSDSDVHGGGGDEDDGGGADEGDVWAVVVTQEIKVSPGDSGLSGQSPLLA